jgi:hypothetical protein
LIPKDLAAVLAVFEDWVSGDIGDDGNGSDQ